MTRKHKYHNQIKQLTNDLDSHFASLSIESDLMFDFKRFLFMEENYKGSNESIDVLERIKECIENKNLKSIKRKWRAVAVSGWLKYVIQKYKVPSIQVSIKITNLGIEKVSREVLTGHIMRIIEGIPLQDIEKAIEVNKVIPAPVIRRSFEEIQAENDTLMNKILNIEEELKELMPGYIGFTEVVLTRVSQGHK